MSVLKERLDRLKEKIQSDDFLDGRGLSNEINISIFCYDASEEMVVRDFMRQLHEKQDLKCQLIEKDLYEVFLEACDDLGITAAIPEMEEVEGAEYLLEQLRNAIRASDFANKIEYQPHKRGEVLILTGVGDVFPFMRVHILLEALQPKFTDIPILVMYPGKFSNHQLTLFNILEPKDYYRAFNMI